MVDRLAGGAELGEGRRWLLCRAVINEALQHPTPQLTSCPQSKANANTSDNPPRSTIEALHFRARGATRPRIFHLVARVLRGVGGRRLSLWRGAVLQHAAQVARDSRQAGEGARAFALLGVLLRLHAQRRARHHDRAAGPPVLAAQLRTRLRCARCVARRVKRRA